MKTIMSRMLSFVAAIALLLSGNARVVNAQGDPSVKPSAPVLTAPGGHRAHLPSGALQDKDGNWYMPADQAALNQPANPSPQSTGGPDDFGYTWNDAVALSWVDVSSGANRTDDPVNLGFNFKYYENTYSQIYVSQYGYADFGDDLYRNQSYLPDPSSPNNVIAPYWAPLYTINGYIRYRTGGTAPNRYFVAEWNQVGGSGMSENYTFEAILYEKGDIVFQYKTMTYLGGYDCQASGIEDSLGLDGLAITGFCSTVSSNHAVRIYRPAAAARVSIHTLYQGNFTHPGGTSTFEITITNTGELGSDTYDLLASSFNPLQLYAADGTTLLTDTDSDGTIDTGLVSQGAATTIVAKTQTSNSANVGDASTASIIVRSSLNVSKSKTVTLQTAIPAPFAQVYRDDFDGAMSLYLAQPGGQAVKQTTDPYWYGYNMATAEAPNGNFAYVWAKGRCLDNHCNTYTYEIEYTLLNKFGETLHAVSKLTNNTGATVSGIYDDSPAVAVAPDGRIGVVWYRYQYLNTNNTDLYNYNIYFAILDPAGSVAYGPVNLTNNTSWGDWSSITEFYNPQITATGDNRFILAWNKYQRVTNCSSNDCSLQDIYYAVRSTSGSLVKAVTQFTFDTTGSNWEGYYYPNLTALSSNRALLTWTRGSGEDVYYAVLNSAGNVVKDKTVLSVDHSSWDSDAVQLSDGKIMVAWTSWNGGYNIRFAVLDANYTRIVNPTSLSNPAAAITGSSNVSITADKSGHAILTWMDNDYNSRTNLYYALLNSSGAILTQPMIFRTSLQVPPFIETNYDGYGNTSYSSAMTSGVDNAVWPDRSLTNGVPGGAAKILVKYANRGLSTATGVVLTATLATGLTYRSDTSGVTPTIVGNQLTWNFADLDFLASGQFLLMVNVPDTALIGTLYQVTLTVAANETDTNPSDNSASFNVMAAIQSYLPMVSH